MIKTISLKNITQSYFEKTILEGVSFKCTEQEKICIVGENGTGKSTILKIIAGTNEPTSGAIEKNAHIRCYYVTQEFDKADTELTIEGYISKRAGASLFKKVFDLGRTIGFDLEKNKDALCGSLSGGQQKVLALAVGLATQPDFLLLDEPENHLDIVSRMELIALLQDYPKGILFVSHDRLMIDSVATKVAEVTGKKIHISEGGYQGYIEARLSRIAGMQREYDAERKRMKEIKESLHILHMKAFRGKNASLYHARKKELEELKERHAETSRPEDKKTKIKISSHGPGLHSGKLLCRIKDASFKYPTAKGDTFRDIDLEMRTGSHIVLLGRNGSGKSTFFKCLTGAMPLTTGTITWMEGIKSVYFDQHMEFDGSMTPVEIVMERLKCHDTDARAALGAMKFDSDKMETRIESLSGGERMRIRFALVFGASPDFIILDEPTNHLDEVTWEILLDACNASKSTILLVTHDYEFIESLNSKVFWVLQGQSIRERHKDLPALVEELKG